MTTKDAGASPVDASVGRPAPQVRRTPQDFAKCSGVDRADLPLIERLRCFDHPNEEGERLMQEAADELERMNADIDVAHDLCERMADILDRTAVALRGPEPPLTRWSWHDLPERASAELSRLRDWIEGDCRCTCCEQTRDCVDGCTFADDDPSGAERMAEARAVLYGPNVANKLPSETAKPAVAGQLDGIVSRRAPTRRNA